MITLLQTKHMAMKGYVDSIACSHDSKCKCSTKKSDIYGLFYVSGTGGLRDKLHFYKG